MHTLCTICSDLINPAENIHTTKCGHIFHYECLAQWIERSNTCPQCRNKVTGKCMFRLYPTIANEVSSDDAATLQSRLDNAQLQLRQQAATCKTMEEKVQNMCKEIERKDESLKSMEKKLISRESAVSALKEQLEYVKTQNKETQKLKAENEVLKNNLMTLTGLEKVLNATSEEVEQMLLDYKDVRTVATFANALKRALCSSESRKNEYRNKLDAVKQQLTTEKRSCADWQAKFMQVQEKVSVVERKYEALKNKRKASESFDKSLFDSSFETSVKQQRRSTADQPKTDCVAVSDNNISFNSMLYRIENADSPYLNLKQSSLALVTLQRPATSERVLKLQEPKSSTSRSFPGNKSKSELENVPANFEKGALSIFHRKEPPKMEFVEEKKTNLDELNISYDGLGGHSKLDTFPVANKSKGLKIPKMTARHRLKRPPAISTKSGNQDIGAMIERLQSRRNV